MGTGLTFEEYLDVKLRPSPRADRAFHEGARMERDEMFPMTTAAASTHLRSRGYDCRASMLELLVENGTIQLAQPDTWTREDVDAAAERFEEHEMFVPYAAMCQTLGCRYVAFLRPLREAAERESAKWGRAIPDSDQYFVMHRVPPRSDSDSIITFTLCDDIRERLERGEVV